MADKITETDVVQIQAQDSDNNKYSFNVEYPKAGTTIANVREAFQPLINSGKWISKQGFPFTYIPQATLTKTKKIELDDGASAVTVTPAEYHPTDVTKEQTQTVTFTVDGAPIQGVKFKDINDGIIVLKNPSINATNNTFTITITTAQGTSTQGRTIIQLATPATTIEIPIYNYLAS